MNSDIRQATALVLLGIAIGCAMSYVYFAAFLSDRANDGMPIATGGTYTELQTCRNYQ